MRSLGFETLLADHLQAPIIVTFRMPADPRFVFEDFYGRLRGRGYVIYPGKLTVAPSFRIGCIGRIGPDEVRHACGHKSHARGDGRGQRHARRARGVNTQGKAS
jgi:2-aminoethylphosphonate-pyruvate transaminase